MLSEPSSLPSIGACERRCEAGRARPPPLPPPAEVGVGASGGRVLWVAADDTGVAKAGSSNMSSMLSAVTLKAALRGAAGGAGAGTGARDVAAALPPPWEKYPTSCGPGSSPKSSSNMLSMETRRDAADDGAAAAGLRAGDAVGFPSTPKSSSNMSSMLSTVLLSLLAARVWGCRELDVPGLPPKPNALAWSPRGVGPNGPMSSMDASGDALGLCAAARRVSWGRGTCAVRGWSREAVVTDPRSKSVDSPPCLLA